MLQSVDIVHISDQTKQQQDPANGDHLQQLLQCPQRKN
jgi:hypothetical protein